MSDKDLALGEVTLKELLNVLGKNVEDYDNTTKEGVGSRGNVIKHPYSYHYNEYRELTKGLGDLCELSEKFGVILAGGALTSVFTNKEINDFDLYFRGVEQFSGFLSGVLSGYYGYYRITSITDKSITIKDLEDSKIQLIYYRWYNTPEEIFKSFDFSINMGSLDFKDGSFYLYKDFLKHNAQRYIEVNTATDYPLMSVLRVEKYRDRGYEVSKAQVLSLLLKVNSLDISSWEDVISHCGGMYGINPQDIFDTEKEWSIEEAISQLNSLPLSAQKMKPDLSKVIGVDISIWKEYKKLQGKVIEDLYKRLSEGEVNYNTDIKSFKEIYLDLEDSVGK